MSLEERPAKHRVLVVATHPDDETLGMGGTILRHVQRGDEVHWIVATQNVPSRREAETRHVAIESVREAYELPYVRDIRWAAMRLDATPMADLVDEIRAGLITIEPDTLYLPYAYDAHSDHRAVFEAAFAAAKPFRAPSVKRVLMMETLSETDQATVPFAPNWYVPLTAEQVERKIEIMRLYKGEMGEPPFPRSAEAIRAQAVLRGAACGAKYAEAFMLLREIVA